jgi:hypothetical protein
MSNDDNHGISDSESVLFFIFCHFIFVFNFFIHSKNMAAPKTPLEQLDDEMNQMTIKKNEFLVSYRRQMAEKRKEKRELLKVKPPPPEVI